jgi:H/ACA ribonucleoprotein complex subunit 4
LAASALATAPLIFSTTFKNALQFHVFMNEILLRQGKPSQKFGKRPSERTTKELLENGIVNIDKPSGPSSHQVSAYVKYILRVKKSGHAGTLDPRVTGVLPVAIGRGTRVVQALLPSGKTYVCVMHVHKDIPEESIREAFIHYIGKIKQLPPVKSAVKRQVRERNIYALELLDMQHQDVLFTADVQAGTYIRKLCHDMGEYLGCGAHMVELRRTRAGPFRRKRPGRTSRRRNPPRKIN